jgi:hypothetical protein
VIYLFLNYRFARLFISVNLKKQLDAVVLWSLDVNSMIKNNVCLCLWGVAGGGWGCFSLPLSKFVDWQTFSECDDGLVWGWNALSFLFSPTTWNQANNLKVSTDIYIQGISYYSALFETSLVVRFSISLINYLLL